MSSDNQQTQGTPAPPPYPDPYQNYPTSANPNAYQPLYNQQYAPQGQYTQPYAPYQPQYGQVYGQQQPYAQYQAAYVATPQTTCHDHHSSGTGIGWILFIIGFFIPICWLIGSFFICSSNPRDQRSGRANLVGFTVLVIVITIIAITAST